MNNTLLVVVIAFASKSITSRALVPFFAMSLPPFSFINILELRFGLFHRPKLVCGQII